MSDIIIQLRDVQSVYSGRNNTCCCGCAGKHTDIEENSKVVKQHVKRINQLLRDGHIDLAGPTFISATSESGQRVYIAYYKKR
jgi:hypothetical protein